MGMESLSDVTIICGEFEMACHKLVLASRSKVFQKMFQEEEFKGQAVVNIKDVDLKVT